MTAVKLASPTFKTGPQDDLAVLDSYKKLQSGVVNSIQEIGALSTEGIMGTMRGGLESATKLSILSKFSFDISGVNGLLGKLSDGANPLTGMVKNASESLKGAMAGAMPVVSMAKSSLQSAQAAISTANQAVSSIKQQANAVTNQVNSVRNTVGELSSFVNTTVQTIAQARQTLTSIGSLPNQLFANIGGSFQQVGLDSLRGLTEIGNLLGSISKDDNRLTVKDRDSEAAIMTGLMSRTAYLGVAGSYGAVTDGTTDPILLRNIAAIGLPSIVTAADIKSLLQMGEKNGASVVRQLKPDVLASVAANYRERTLLTTQERIDRYSAITLAFNIIDSEWDNVTRQTDAGPVSAISLVALQNASYDFNQTIRIGAFNSGISDEKLYLLADAFKQTSVDQELRAKFPYTLTGPQVRLQETTSDPRVMFA